MSTSTSNHAVDSGADTDTESSEEGGIGFRDSVYIFSILSWLFFKPYKWDLVILVIILFVVPHVPILALGRDLILNAIRQFEDLLLAVLVKSVWSPMYAALIAATSVIVCFSVKGLCSLASEARRTGFKDNFWENRRCQLEPTVFIKPAIEIIYISLGAAVFSKLFGDLVIYLDTLGSGA